MEKITPILLAGGYGTRLWPLSRKCYPKQFSTLLGDETLFQSSAKRLVSSQAVQFDATITITNSDFRFIVTVSFEKWQEIFTLHIAKEDLLTGSTTSSLNASVNLDCCDEPVPDMHYLLQPLGKKVKLLKHI